MAEIMPKDILPFTGKLDVQMEPVEPGFLRVSLLDAPNMTPDYYRIISVAERYDSGSNLLTEILAQTGYTQSLPEIAKNKQDYSLNTEKQTEFKTKASTEGLTAEEDSQQKFLSKELGDLAIKLATWEELQARIAKANEYYQAVYINPYNGTLNRDVIQELYDETGQYEDSGLLKIIRELQAKVPKPRELAGGRRSTSPAINNLAVADRLTRILLLEETGQLSFD